jgi:hypothetical protein
LVGLQSYARNKHAGSSRLQRATAEEQCDVM